MIKQRENWSLDLAEHPFAPFDRGDDMQADLHIWLERQQVCHPQEA